MSDHLTSFNKRFRQRVLDEIRLHGPISTDSLYVHVGHFILPEVARRLSRFRAESASFDKQLKVGRKEKLRRTVAYLSKCGLITKSGQLSPTAFLWVIGE
jgi:hypothetical protein